ncbi:MAG: hypothetical protein RIT43_1071, partial [Bacteroidota bacterium]
DRFTGREPEDRVFYVTYGSRDHAMTGFENCASSGEMVPGPIDMAHAASLTYEEMLEQARFDAAEMFDLWKHSPGHNQNMLDAQHLAHGTSIIYNHATGSTYATSVFTQVQQYYSPDTLTLAFHPGWESDFKVNYKENYPDYKPYPQGMNRMSFKYFSSIVQEMNKLGCQPDERLHELSKVSPANESQRDLKKRFLKSTYYLGVFKLMKYRLQGQYFEKTYSQDEFYTLTGVNDLKAHLVHTSSLRDADFWGGTFDTKESGSGQTKVTFRTLTLIPKK